MQQIKLGKYQHHKGKFYDVLALAHHSETLEDMVVYQALYDSPEFGPDAIWVRPLAMFTDEVDVDGKKVPRFRFVE